MSLLSPARAGLLVVSIACLLLAGCSAKLTKSAAATPEQRAQERWDALLARDFQKAFTYLSPGMRSASTPDAYAAQMGVRPVKWKGARVLESDCTDDAAAEACRVTVQIDFTVPASIPGIKELSSTSSLSERWIRVDGVWYYVSRQVALGQ